MFYDRYDTDECAAQAIPEGMRLILVGDIDQLPSVGREMYCVTLLIPVYFLWFV